MGIKSSGRRARVSRIVSRVVERYRRIEKSKGSVRGKKKKRISKTAVEEVTDAVEARLDLTGLTQHHRRHCRAGQANGHTNPRRLAE